jgi:hypothetical protein
MRSIVVLVLLVALWIVFAQQGRGPVVNSVVMATALDSQFKPVEVTESYNPDEDFFASVNIQDYSGSKPLIGRWMYEGSEFDTSAYDGDQAGSGYVGFTVHSDIPWQPGRYRIDILYEDEVLGSASFEVVAGDDGDD